MSRSFEVPIGLVPLASDPATGSNGDIYFNTTSNVVRVYFGGAWSNVSAGGASGVTQIIAGTNVTISPVGGTGAVTINASGGGAAGDASFVDFLLMGG